MTERDYAGMAREILLPGCSCDAECGCPSYEEVWNSITKALESVAKERDEENNKVLGVLATVNESELDKLRQEMDKLRDEIEDYKKAASLTELLIGSDKAVLIREISSLRLRLARMEKSLKPFAELAEEGAMAPSYMHKEWCKEAKQALEEDSHEEIK